MDRNEKLPERKHFGILTPRGQQKVDRENNKISRENAKGAPGKEPTDPDVLAAHERRQQLSANQVTAQDEEKIDADPAKTVDAAGRFKTEEGGVINGDDDDGKGAEKIKPRLAFTVRETRIDFGRRRSEVGGQRADCGIRRTRCRCMMAIGSG